MLTGFIILHYQSINDTICCVDSIVKNVNDYVIVIVDNCSPNKSGLDLLERYRLDKNVNVILNDTNSGFAKGNNIGYAYLNKNYDCDFICCANNDTVLLDCEFEKHINQDFGEYGFSVLAPKVLLLDGSIQSFNPVLQSIDYYKNQLERYEHCLTYQDYIRNMSIIGKLFVFSPAMMSTFRKIKQRIKAPYKKHMEDVVLHGCFLVFSKLYISNFDTAFDPDTFMYREEELLYLRVKSKNLKTLYSENMTICHKEKAATKQILKSQDERYDFIRNNQIASTRILINRMDELKFTLHL